MIGAITCIVIIGSIIIFIIICIKKICLNIYYKLKIKRRFNNPPLAKCYCKDCKKWDTETHRCYKFDRWHTNEAWFCWDAEPKGYKNKDE